MIDAYVRVAVIGIELVTIDARIVIASVDTYLRFAEQVNRLDLTQTELAGLPELQEKGSEKMTEGAIEGAEDAVTPDSPPSRRRPRAPRQLPPSALRLRLPRSSPAASAPTRTRTEGEHDREAARRPRSCSCRSSLPARARPWATS